VEPESRFCIGISSRNEGQKPMVDQRKKERQKAPGGDFNPQDMGEKKHEIKEPPKPTDDPKRKKKIADA
jgi:hypothetical protein